MPMTYTIDTTKNVVRAVGSGVLTAGGMHKLAVVADDNVAYGMSRMYQTLDEPNIRSVGVFRRMEEAEEWLGIA